MKKSSREKLINHLQKIANCNTETELAKYLGVNKQKVSYMKSEKGGLDYDLLLEKFGQETLKFLSIEYGIIQETQKEERQEKAGKLLAEAIQLLSGQKKEEKLSLVATANVTEVPHYTHRIAAGTPADSSSPAEKIALPSLLVKHPRDTYAVTVTGDSMLGANIEEGDILIVDTAIEPTNKSIIIASINGEQTVKRLLISGKTVSLAPENHNYQTTEITGDTDFRTLGVVTWIIRRAG